MGDLTRSRQTNLSCSRTTPPATVTKMLTGLLAPASPPCRTKVSADLAGPLPLPAPWKALTALPEAQTHSTSSQSSNTLTAPAQSTSTLAATVATPLLPGNTTRTTVK